SGPGSPRGQPAWGGGSDRPDAQLLVRMGRLHPPKQQKIVTLESSVWPVATALGSDTRLPKFLHPIGSKD
ncbi:MAG: hypothetical protein AABN34_29755, partial [Acidobacteriota bacterium]